MLTLILIYYSTSFDLIIVNGDMNKKKAVIRQFDVLALQAVWD